MLSSTILAAVEAPMSSAPATILPDSERLRLLGLVGDAEGIVATVAAIAPVSVCPQCAHPSGRIHSHYVRHVADLPWHGVAFRLELHVRRFFCDHAVCAQRIFTERLPGIVTPSARTTLRLSSVLHHVALAVGGAAGKRLLASLGVPGLRRHSAGVSRDTLLRLIRRPLLPTPTPLRIVGIDDFSLGRNHRGGTILVDLERHHVVDLLGESTTTAATAWLSAQPDIVILSRDRGESYVEAARLAAPQAIPVADRWHILHNLSEVTQAVFERHRLDLRAVAQALAAPVSSPRDPQTAGSSGGAVDAPLVVPLNTTQRSPPAAPLARPLKPRQELFDQTKQLAARGWSGVRIAQHLRINRRTVRRYLLADCLPEKARAPQTTSSLAAYDAYLLQRWAEGCHIGVQVFADLQEQGYRGGLSSVYRAMDRLQLPRTWPRKASPACPSPPPRKPLVSRPKSPRQAMWLLILRPERLTPEQEAYRAQLCAICPDAAVMYPLVQRLGMLIREHRVADLEAWLQEAEESGIPEFMRFARSLRRDQAAVSEAFTSRWSQGQTEGFITKLKLLKRSMYGRAKADLLRLRLRLLTGS
jgi:transposase